MILNKKKKINYINERFNEMNNEINTLKTDNTELRSLLNDMETKLLELQFNGDDNDSESSVEKVVTKTTAPTTSADKRRSRMS